LIKLTSHGCFIHVSQCRRIVELPDSSSQYNPVIGPNMETTNYTSIILRTAIQQVVKCRSSSSSSLSSKTKRILLLTPFPRRFPWREMLQRKDWPSSEFPNEPSCNLYRPSADRVCGSCACEQFGYRVVYLKRADCTISFLQRQINKRRPLRKITPNVYTIIKLSLDLILEQHFISIRSKKTIPI